MLGTLAGHLALTNPNTAGTIRVWRNAWLALLLDDRFDGTPEALRWLCCTERDTLNSFTPEEFVREIHDPAACRKRLPDTTFPPLLQRPPDALAPLLQSRRPLPPGRPASLASVVFPNARRIV